jgi:hypothetical protein
MPACPQSFCVDTQLRLLRYSAMFAPPRHSLNAFIPSRSSAQGCAPPVHAGGLVYGFVGAGGNTGGAITQAIFFTPASLEPYDSFKWLG